MNTLKTKWRPAYVCNQCQNVNSFDGAYLTCESCGSTSGSFKSVRDIYDIKVFFKFIKIPVHRTIEIRY